MALIGLQDINAGYGGPPLLSGISFQVEEGDRICLLGRNGAGKSTLLKLIAGQLTPEKGYFSKASQITITCLTQDVPTELAGTVYDQISSGLGEDGKLLAQYHLISHRLVSDPHNESLLGQLDKLHHALDIDDRWQSNRLVDVIIEKMSLNPDVEVASLSAGMKRRVLLAQALVRHPDVLLLDEPTNHLDIDAIKWLEDFLMRYKGTLIFVTHDRAFLKKLATRIIEIDRGRLTSYNCDYESHLKRKQEALESEAIEKALFDKKLAAEEVWIRQGILARRGRRKDRVQALMNMRNERAERRDVVGNVRLKLHKGKVSGKMVIDAKEISFAYEPNKPIISNFSTTIMRGDKVGIIGPNGSGKTTLLRVLLNELTVQQGLVRHGTKLEIAYFDQLHAQLEYDKSVSENVAGISETIMFNGVKRHIIAYLEDFLFTPAQARNTVRDLSGGERNRLLFARLFTRPSNVLVLDEPTNDLDIETLDLLEEFLVNYPGTVLMVSHDREFLNNVVTSTMVLEGNGVVQEYVGGYDDWLRQRKLPQENTESAKPAKPVIKKERPRKLTFNEKRELGTLPALIEKLEKEKRQLHDEMVSPDFYKKGSAITTVTDRFNEVSIQLDQAYARWEILESIPKE